LCPPISMNNLSNITEIVRELAFLSDWEVEVLDDA